MEFEMTDNKERRFTARKLAIAGVSFAMAAFASVATAGSLSDSELQGISQKSCNILKDMGPEIQWLESYVTDDKVYCKYIAPNEDAIRKHAETGGFPANRISEVKNTIDPTTSE